MGTQKNEISAYEWENKHSQDLVSLISVRARWKGSFGLQLSQISNNIFITGFHMAPSERQGYLIPGSNDFRLFDILLSVNGEPVCCTNVVKIFENIKNQQVQVIQFLLARRRPNTHCDISVPRQYYRCPKLCPKTTNDAPPSSDSFETQIQNGKSVSSISPNISDINNSKQRWERMIQAQVTQQKLLQTEAKSQQQRLINSYRYVCKSVSFGLKSRLKYQKTSSIDSLNHKPNNLKLVLNSV